MNNEQNFTPGMPGSSPLQSETAAGEGKQKPLIDKEGLAGFYRESLPVILKTIFRSPVDGTYSLFAEKTEKKYFNSLVLMASTGLLYVIVPYLLIGGEMRQAIGFFSMIKVGIAVVVLMLLVAVMSFCIKSISGKPVFKNELFTGGVCGIPMTGLLVVMIIARIFMGDAGDMMSLGLDWSLMLRKLGILLLLVFYLLLLLINILQQSLRADGTKDAPAWYLAPLGIMVSFYLTEKIIQILL